MANENIFETAKYNEITFYKSELEDREAVSLTNDFVKRFKQAVALGKIIIREQNGRINYLSLAWGFPFDFLEQEKEDCSFVFGGYGQNSGMTLEIDLNFITKTYTSKISEI